MADVVHLRREAPMAKRRDILRKLSIESGVPERECVRILELALAIIRDTVWIEGVVRWPGFGVWKVRRHAGKTISHPREPELSIEVPAREVVSFRPAPSWRTR